MAITPIQNVWFDDAATSTMGEAFDRACKSLLAATVIDIGMITRTPVNAA